MKQGVIYSRPEIDLFDQEVREPAQYFFLMPYRGKTSAGEIRACALANFGFKSIPSVSSGVSLVTFEVYTKTKLFSEDVEEICRRRGGRPAGPSVRLEVKP